MKKLGLRVLAGGLAALMTVSVLAPAKIASAENDLLIAPAPTAALNTLYITADMVDSDNEIIISGEDWDRIVVTKEAAAANIYFDAVEVGELVVESGSDSVIQLWDVAAGKVTVKEPELKEIDMTTLRVLLTEEETRQQAVDYFMRVQAENEKVLHSYPRIVTMEDATVDTISAGAGIRLDLHEGAVKALNVEASAKLDRMDVTLEGYNGDVTYVGNKGFSVVNLKNVDSRINKLTVADSTASNYLNVSSKDSVALNVEVAGDAKVALNIPMGELTIAEAAKAAKVDVLNAVDSMNVAADNAQVEIAPIGNIAQASITGDKVTINGAGVLTEVVILGKDAYVSTKGTDVEGENTYVEPVYVEPKVVVKDTYDNMTAGATTLTKNSDGSATISFSGQYQTATFNVPATVDINRIRSITIEVTTKAQFGVSVVTKGGEAVVSEYPGYGITEETKKEFTYYINPAEQKIGKIGLMSLNAGQPDMVLNSVTFTLYDEGKAPTPKPTPPPAAPSDLNLPAGSKEWQFADLPCELTSWADGITSTSAAANNGVMAEYKQQWAYTRFTLPEALTVGDFEKVIVTLSSATGPLGIELLDADSKVVAFWWNKKETATTDLNLTYNTTGYGGNSSVDATALAKQVTKVNIMYIGDGEGAEAILYRIAFVAKPGAGSGDTPTPTTKPETPPSAAPEELTFKFADMEDGGYGYTLEKDAPDGGVNVAINGQYQEVFYMLPQEIDLAYYDKAIFSMKTDTAEDKVVLKIVAPDAELDQYNNPAPMVTQWGVTTSGVENVEVSLAAHADKKVSRIGIMASDGPANLTLYSITFVLKEGAGGEDTPTPTPETPPADGTKCSSDQWTIHRFTDYDLRKYVGKTIKYSVAMKVINAPSDAPVKAIIECNDSKENASSDASEEYVGWTKVAEDEVSITGEWQTFEGEWTVPEDIGYQLSPVYFGFSFVNSSGEGDFEKGYKDFYYKDFLFEGEASELPPKPEFQDILIDFSDGNKYFKSKYGPTVEVKELENGEFALYVSGREADWQGAWVNLSNYDFTGKTIELSCKVMHEETDPIIVCIGADCQYDGETDPVYAGNEVEAAPGEWAEYKEIFIFEEPAVTTIFSFQTEDSPTASFYIKDVSIKVVPVGIKTPEKTTLAIGEELLLEAATTPIGGEVTWSSSDDAIAEVDAAGKVTAKAVGTVTITAACEGESDSVDLTVEAAPGGDTPGPEVPPEETSSVEITTPAKDTLAIGENLELSATASGTVTWSSSDAAIAEVDATGKVTAKAAGTVTITANCGEATDEVELTVGLAVTDKTFTPKDCSPDMHGWTQSGEAPYPYVAEYLDDTEAIKVEFAEQFAEIKFMLPEGIDLSKYDKLRIKLDTKGTAEADRVIVKLTDNRAPLGEQWGAPVPFFVAYECTQSPAGVIEFDLTDKSEYVADRVGIAANTGECVAEIYEISFVAKEGAVLTLPTDGTLHDLKNGGLIKIDTNFKTLAGKEVKISAEVLRFGDILVKAHGQFINQWGTGLHWSKSINTVWTDFGKTFTVPAEWENATDDIYYAINLLLDENTDYSTTKFYYKNFKVEVVE